jgi:hypothetical protein
VNVQKVGQATVFAAAVMILVTFAPESLLTPFKTFFQQVRMNNASVSPPTQQQDSGVLESAVNSVKKAFSSGVAIPKN